MLSDTMDNIGERTLHLHIGDIDNEVVAGLAEHVTSTPGKINLRVRVVDSREGVLLHFFSRRHKISLTPELVEFLESNEINSNMA